MALFRVCWAFDGVFVLSTRTRSPSTSTRAAAITWRLRVGGFSKTMDNRLSVQLATND
jgi:hypothetical protein